MGRGARAPPGEPRLEVGKPRRRHHIVSIDVFLDLIGDARHNIVALGDLIQRSGPKLDQGLIHVCNGRWMVPVAVRIHDAHGHHDKVALHELILHAERILLAAEERFKVGTTDSKREGPKIFRLLVLCSHRCVQFQGRAIPVLDVHLQRESPPVFIERRGYVRGCPIILVNPRVHEDLLGRDCVGRTQLVNLIHW